jgi:hypothetical protein
MNFQAIQPTATANSFVLSIRCPRCGQVGTFESFGNVNDVFSRVGNGIVFGQRRCPNPKCSGHVFFVEDKNTSSVYSYPPESVELNKDNIPARILSTIEEAITCYTHGCYIAAAIMIRKTLEEIAVEKSAEGKNLFLKLQDLSAKIFVPKELIEAMTELRLLGNDAAHIEAETFNQIGKNEIEISIEFAKEIIKAVYQYESLLGRLRGLKKTNS